MLNHKIKIIPDSEKNKLFKRSIKENDHIICESIFITKNCSFDIIYSGTIKYLDCQMTYVVFFDGGFPNLFSNGNYTLLKDIKKVLRYGKELNIEEEKSNKDTIKYMKVLNGVI
jgi:hypothetical protein